MGGWNGIKRWVTLRVAWKLGLGLRQRYKVVPDQLLASKWCLRWVLIKMRKVPTFISFCSLLYTLFLSLSILTSVLLRRLELSLLLLEINLNYILSSLIFASWLAVMVPAFEKRCLYKSEQQTPGKHFTTNWFLSQALSYRLYVNWRKYLLKSAAHQMI